MQQQLTLDGFPSALAPQGKPKTFKRARLPEGASQTSQAKTPRPYQIQMLKDAYALMAEGHWRILTIATPGSGKTYWAAMVIRDFVRHSKHTSGRCVFLVDLSSLLYQTADEVGEALGEAADGLRSHGVKCRVVQGRSRPDPNSKDVLVISRQWLDARFRAGDTAKGLLGDVGLFLGDEAHTLAFSAAYQQLEYAYAHRPLARADGLEAEKPKTYFIGLTGTPWRTSGKEWLGMYYDATVLAPQPPEIVKMGGVLPARCYWVGHPDYNLSRVRLSKAGDDFDAQAIEDLTTQQAFATWVIQKYMEIAPGTAGAGFCSSVKAAHFMAEQFNQAGIASAVIAGSTKLRCRYWSKRAGRGGQVRRCGKCRECIKEQVNQGRVLIIWSVSAVTAGFNLPILQTSLYCTATVSLAKFHQANTRVGRPHKGQQWSSVLDFGGNITPIEEGGRGFPSPTAYQDYDISEPPQRRDRASAPPPTKDCWKCGKEVLSFAQECPYCHADLRPEDDGSELVLDAELVELATDQVSPAMLHFLRSAKREAYQRDANPGTAVELFIRRYGFCPPDAVQKHLLLGPPPHTLGQLEEFLEYLERHSPTRISFIYWQRTELGRLVRRERRQVA